LRSSSRKHRFVAQHSNAMSRRGLHSQGPDEGLPFDGGDVGATKAVAVLLVEDDAAIVSALAEALRAQDMAVATAGNGHEALQMLRNGLRPSVIVLDLMMPVMDGWDFRHEQLHDPALRDIPVVVVTATGFSADTIRAQFGDVDMLPKPVPYPDLLALLGRSHGVGSTAP
jgi:CheY-like chemotaxis protein